MNRQVTISAAFLGALLLSYAPAVQADDDYCASYTKDYFRHKQQLKGKIDAYGQCLAQVQTSDANMCSDEAGDVMKLERILRDDASVLGETGCRNGLPQLFPPHS